MKKNRLAIILGSLLLLLAAGAVGFIILWNSPLLGKRLPVFLPAGAANRINSSGEDAEDPGSSVEQQLGNGGDPSDADNSETDDVVLDSKESADPASEPLCGGPESIIVLVLVVDQHAQADVIRLVRIDFVKPEVVMTAIPRDFYVSVVDMAEHGITKGRINATFGYGEKFNGNGGGIISLATNITHNFGVNFDHYMVLNKYKVDKYVDFVGGVDVYLEETVTDGVSTFRSGENHLDGEAAIRFLSMRYFDDDFHRIERQHLFMEAFYNNVVNELSVFQQSQLGLNILLDKSIQTDFTAKDVYPLTCLARTINSQDVHFVTIPSEMYHSYTTESGGAVQIPHESVAPFLQNVMDGGYYP